MFPTPIPASATSSANMISPNGPIIRSNHHQSSMIIAE
jgi:hypothetical protein